MSQFDRMRIFTQVVQSNGFSSAAKELKLTTASVSKQVSLLEEEMNIKLMIRTTRKIELTEEGRPFFEKCVQLIQEYEDTKNFAYTLNGEPRGELHVVVTRYFGQQFVLPYLSDFLNQYPKISLNLELAERIPDLEKEKIDIFFAVSLPGAPDWIQKTISKTRYTFCASPKYLKKHGTPTLPGELAQHRYISHSMRKPHRTIEFSSEVKVSLEPYLTLNDTQSILQCALDGVGIVRLHEYMVSSYIKNRKLVEVYPKWNRVEVPVYLFYQPNKYLQPKVRKFIEYFSPKVKLD